MKKQILTFLNLLIISIVVGQTKVYIPDANFRDFLTVTYPTYMDGDSLICDSAALETGSLQCFNRSIANLAGIECFINLTYLNCASNQMTSLPDISAMTSLQKLDCGNNQLTTLPDLSPNIALSILYCSSNQLETLPDLSSNTALKVIFCQSNQLATLPDLSSNTGLEELLANYNQLTTLPDLSANTALQEITVNYNQLINLPDLSTDTALTGLYCQSNYLTALPDLSANTSLTRLNCSYNQLTCLPDLFANTNLLILNCRSNQLTSLPDLSNCISLDGLACDHNKLDYSDARELIIINDLPNLTGYTYTPQDPFGFSDTLILCEGDSIILCIASQDSALSYQWFKNAVPITGETDTILTIPNANGADAGTYTCKSYGTALLMPPMTFCPGIFEFVSEPFIVDINSTVEKEEDFEIIIYPNPANNILFVNIIDVMTELEIINAQGQKLSTHSLTEKVNSLDISNLPSGVYTLRIKTDRGIAIRKLIKQ